MGEKHPYSFCDCDILSERKLIFMVFGFFLSVGIVKDSNEIINHLSRALQQLQLCTSLSGFPKQPLPTPVTPTQSTLYSSL